MHSSRSRFTGLFRSVRAAPPAQFAGRRLAPLPLLIIVLAALAVLVLIPGDVVAQTNNAATGLPRIVVSAEGPGILGVDTWDIRDADGLPYGPPNPFTTTVGSPPDGRFTFDFSYQWIRVDGGTEVNVGSDSPRYQLVDADFGKKFKVQVSFTDQDNNAEAVTSVPFGPIARPVSLPSPTTLVANTDFLLGLTTTMIISDYAIGFNLGDHGQGYEISSVLIDLAAVPSNLSVSLWTSGPPGGSGSDTRRAKLFEFENPDSFAVGLNEFTAPAGVYALHARKHWIVLSGFGSSLSIKEITSDDQDGISAQGALIDNEAGGNTNVLRLDIKGSDADHVGILAANLAQPGTEANQEVISVGDKIGWTIDLGSADRFLVRGMAITGDDTTSVDGGFDDPWYFRSDDFDGTRHFRMFLTRNVNGLPTWTAPQGATVPGDSTYALQWAAGKESFKNDGVAIERIGAVLHRSFHVDVAADGRTDVPSAAGTTLGKGDALSANDADGPTPYMVVYGVPLYTIVENLGQTDNGHVSVGGTNDVVSQGFTTGSRTGGYALPGIGVNIEGSAGVRHSPDSRRRVGSVGVGARRLERGAGREAVRPPQPHRIRGGPQLLRGAKGGAPGAQHLLRSGLAPQQRRQPPAGEDHGQQRGLGGGTRSQHRERVPPGRRCGQPDRGQQRQCAGDHGVHGAGASQRHRPAGDPGYRGGPRRPGGGHLVHF